MLNIKIMWHLALSFVSFSILVEIRTFAEKEDDLELSEVWEKYKNVHNKQYKETDDIIRRKHFKHNADRIAAHNLQADLGVHSFTLGLNEYADMPHDEFLSKMTGLLADSNFTRNSTGEFKLSRDVSLPVEVDWRNDGLVTPIKNQGSCGACWAFSSVGCLEGIWAKKNKELISFSEQNLIDCSREQGNYGCNGGLMDYAYDYIMKNGIRKLETYPYTAIDTGSCQYSESATVTKILGYVDVPTGDENALKQAVATVGPISVGIDASSYAFQLYSDGIYKDKICSSDNLNHAIIVVGYGTDGRQDYWLCKNSWGTSWGINGYIKIRRNFKNQCGIATLASYPTI